MRAGIHSTKAPPGRAAIALAGVLLTCSAGGCLGLDLEVPADACRSIADCAPGLLCDRATLACVPEVDDAVGGDFSCDVNADPSTFPGSEVVGRVGQQRAFFGLGATCDLELGVLQVTVLQFDGSLGLLAFVAPEPGRTEYPIVAPTEGYRSPTPQGGRAVVLGAQNEVAAFATKGTLSLEGAPTPGAKLRGHLSVSLARPSPTPNAGRPCAVGVAACGPDSAALCSALEETPFCYQRCDDSAQCPEGTACLEGLCLVPCQAQAECPTGLTCRPTEVIGEGACY
jgi:hypothetical protein